MGFNYQANYDYLVFWPTHTDTVFGQAMKFGGGKKGQQFVTYSIYGNNFWPFHAEIEEITASQHSKVNWETLRNWLLAQQ